MFIIGIVRDFSLLDSIKLVEFTFWGEIMWSRVEKPSSSRKGE